MVVSGDPLEVGVGEESESVRAGVGGVAALVFAVLLLRRSGVGGVTSREQGISTGCIGPLVPVVQPVLKGRD